jgi:hypothetical protein
MRAKSHGLLRMHSRCTNKDARDAKLDVSHVACGSMQIHAMRAIAARTTRKARTADTTTSPDATHAMPANVHPPATVHNFNKPYASLACSYRSILVIDICPYRHLPVSTFARIDILSHGLVPKTELVVSNSKATNMQRMQARLNDHKVSIQLMPTVRRLSKLPIEDSPFYRTAKWVSQREQPPSESDDAFAVIKLCTGNVKCVDVDDIVQKKFDMTAEQAADVRKEYAESPERVDCEFFEATDSVTAIRWYAAVDDINWLLLYVARKKTAETGRAHGRAVATQYIQMRVCDVQIVCGKCDSATDLATTGHLVRDKSWGDYKLDVAIVSDDDKVVGAIEIMTFSALYKQKVEALATSGLGWAEVRAGDVIDAVGEECFSVQAARGGGVCKTCNHTETRDALCRQIAEIGERELRATKRKAIEDKELSELSMQKRAARCKLGRLIV